MKTFVQYGAGNIGRGFIGALFAKAGWAVQFVDVNLEVVDALNREGRYAVEVVSDAGSRDELVTGVSGVNGRDAEAVAEAIANADAMATAVGVHILPRIVPLLAAGLRRRWARGNDAPFNIIICENLLDADKLLHSLLCKEFDAAETALLHSRVGLVEASIGRMVPVMTEAMRRGEILRVCVEEYCQLPVDADAWKGAVPDIPGLFPYSPFAFYIQRKLFVHNMGHATCAYLGSLRGLDYIWQAAGTPAVALVAQRAMQESALALASKFGFPLPRLLEHIDDLLLRFTNRALGDTVARVGRDTGRKLGAADRFAGALRLCAEQNIDCPYVALGAAAGLFFPAAEDDEGTRVLRETLSREGLDAVLRDHMGLDPDGAAAGFIRAYHALLARGADLEALLAQAQSFRRALLAPRRIV